MAELIVDNPTKAIMELTALVEQIADITKKYDLEMACISHYGFSTSISVYDKENEDGSYMVMYGNLNGNKLELEERRRIHEAV